MVHFTVADSDKLYQLVEDAIEHATLGSRTAWKVLQAINPRIALVVEKLSVKGGIQ